MKKCFLSVLVLALASVAGAENPKFKEGEVRGLSYRVFSPKEKHDSYRLVVFLPGGTGDEGFTDWCRAIYHSALPDGSLAVQLIAPPWNNSGTIWPTEFTPTPEMKEPVEDLFSRVVAEVGKIYSLREGEVYTFSWSSGGPAAYVIAATQREVAGHFVAMSVFRESWLPSRLNKVRGQRFFLYHSPEDTVCPIEMANQAKERLEAEGAETAMREYAGGHGWPPEVDHFAAIREGFEFLVRD